MKSKTIIISSNSANSGRGILTLYIEDELLKCKLRLYNVNKLNKYCKLGVYHNNEVFSANLIEREGVYFSSLVGDFDMDSDFYCAIIDTSESNKVLLSGGTYAGFYFNDNSVFEDNEPKADNSIDLDNNTKLESVKKNDDETCPSPDCAHCKYKEYFYNETPKVLNADEIPNENKDKKIEENAAIPTIIDSILPQFDYIFKNYEQNGELNGLIDNSKFVNMNEGDYSLGAIYENGNIKYICYAVKANYNSPAPDELGKHYQWLPLDKDDPLSDGYYLVFQDANDLKIIDV